MSEHAKGQRSSKVLSCTAEATMFQRNFVKELQERVVEKGEPFAIVQADTPHEIFHAMDIPIVTNQWWSSYIAAKQLSTHYVQVLERTGDRVKLLVDRDVDLDGLLSRARSAGEVRTFSYEPPKLSELFMEAVTPEPAETEREVA